MRLRANEVCPIHRSRFLLRPRHDYQRCCSCRGCFFALAYAAPACGDFREPQVSLSSAPLGNMHCSMTSVWRFVKAIRCG